MEKSKCKVCGVEKPLGEFDKILRSGPLEEWNVRRCKECTHQVYLRRYAKPDQRTTQLVASRNWKQENKARHAELAREYRKRHPEKTMAHNRLNYAIKMGRIKRAPCEVCGETERVHAHHLSYDPKDWYNVRWLCGVCHEIEHG